MVPVRSNPSADLPGADRIEGDAPSEGPLNCSLVVRRSLFECAARGPSRPCSALISVAYKSRLIAERLKAFEPQEEDCGSIGVRHHRHQAVPACSQGRTRRDTGQAADQRTNSFHAATARKAARPRPQPAIFTLFTKSCSLTQTPISVSRTHQEVISPMETGYSA